MKGHKEPTLNLYDKACGQFHFQLSYLELVLNHKFVLSQKKYITEIKVWHTVGKRRSRGAKWCTYWVGLTCLPCGNIVKRGQEGAKGLLFLKMIHLFWSSWSMTQTWLLITWSCFLESWQWIHFAIILEVQSIHRETKKTNWTISHLTLNKRNKLKTKKDTASTGQSMGWRNHSKTVEKNSSSPHAASIYPPHPPDDVGFCSMCYHCHNNRYSCV